MATLIFLLAAAVMIWASSWRHEGSEVVRWTAYAAMVLACVWAAARANALKGLQL